VKRILFLLLILIVSSCKPLVDDEFFECEKGMACDTKPLIEIIPLSNQTSEEGTSAFISVVLTEKPTDNVDITPTSDNSGEGYPITSLLTFSPTDWDVPQQIEIVGAPDSVIDLDTPYNIIFSASSLDPKFNGYAMPVVTLVNVDIDNPAMGLNFGGITGNTAEDGTTATFTMSLQSMPSSNVVINFTSTDTSEGTVTPSITFTTANWNAAQTVTITGQDDSLIDGNVSYDINYSISSSDPDYGGVTGFAATVINNDNDVAGVTISSLTISASEGVTTSYTVVLDTQPEFDVTINPASSNSTEANVSSSVTFTPANWSTPQTITVSSFDDLVDEVDLTFPITHTIFTSDSNYSVLSMSDVSYTIVDNDTAGVSVSAISGNTSEAGSTATFTVVLISQPTNDVIIPVSSFDLSEGMPDQSILTFTATDWNVQQTVTVTGVDDFIDDDNVGYLVKLDPATSSDGNYSGYDAGDVSITNIDDDTAGVTVSAISNNITESVTNPTATFTVALDSEPTNDVTISITSDDTTEGTVLPTTLTFSAANWSISQTVTVTSVNDALMDGAQVFNIILGAAASTDPKYSGFDPSDVSLTCIDDDGGLLAKELGQVALKRNVEARGSLAHLNRASQCLIEGDLPQGLSIQDDCTIVGAPRTFMAKDSEPLKLSYYDEENGELIEKDLKLIVHDDICSEGSLSQTQDQAYVFAHKEAFVCRKGQRTDFLAKHLKLIDLSNMDEEQQIETKLNRQVVE
jgi:hypothetical protein